MTGDVVTGVVTGDVVTGAVVTGTVVTGDVTGTVGTGVVGTGVCAPVRTSGGSTCVGARSVPAGAGAFADAARAGAGGLRFPPLRLADPRARNRDRVRLRCRRDAAIDSLLNRA